MFGIKSPKRGKNRALVVQWQCWFLSELAELTKSLMQNQVLELAKHRLTPAKNLKFLKRTKDQLISVKALEISLGKC